MFVKLFEHELPKRILHTFIHTVVNFLLIEIFRPFMVVATYQTLMYLDSDMCYHERIEVITF